MTKLCMILYLVHFMYDERLEVQGVSKLVCQIIMILEFRMYEIPFLTFFNFNFFTNYGFLDITKHKTFI
jgi:hypothetical protein